MMPLQTPVRVDPMGVGLSYTDRIVVLGSCFADGIGRRLAESGFRVCVNPFGTLYNPASIVNAVSRLDCGIPFTKEDVVEMGAGAGLFCSFSHHTSFARETPEAFLQDANEALEKAAAFWKEAGKVIISLGTSYVYRHGGDVVANCLKRPEAEFTRGGLGASETAALLERMTRRHPGKQFIFTVSPVRHLRDGAHGNQLSKAALLLAVDRVCREQADRCAYFPAYEIVLDELRDYRFYAEDMLHPSEQTENYIFDCFTSAVLSPDDLAKLAAAKREAARMRHIPGRRKPHETQ